MTPCCGAPTKQTYLGEDGKRYTDVCWRPVKNFGDRCWQHRGTKA